VIFLEHITRYQNSFLALCLGNVSHNLILDIFLCSVHRICSDRLSNRLVSKVVWFWMTLIYLNCDRQVFLSGERLIQCIWNNH